MHYRRWWVHGDPFGFAQRPSLWERLEAKIDRVSASPCWLWIGSVDNHGYGIAFVYPRSVRAYRAVYEYLVGPVPDELQLDHLCRNPPCVNPDHLEPVTQKENILRGEGVSAVNARKTHCPQGHLYNEANTRYTAGGRVCRTCHRAREHARYHAAH